MFRNILVPLDGSPTAETALEVATGLAQSLSAQVHLVRCLPSAQLSALGLQVQGHVFSGTVAGQIANLAEQKGSDLIVLTSHGRSGISRMVLGSVAETLARCAPCPVLIIRWKPDKI